MTIIKVYGTGCKRCIMLTQLAKDAVEEVKIDCSIEKVEDIQSIVERGILRTPGVEINGKIVSMGDIPDKLKIQQWIKEFEEVA